MADFFHQDPCIIPYFAMLKKKKRDNPGSILLSESVAKVNGVCSGLRPILHPSIVAIRFSFCVVVDLQFWKGASL